MEQGRGSSNLLSLAPSSCPPPSFTLSERPNILALRSSRKAAGLNYVRDVVVVGLDWMASDFDFNFNFKIRIQIQRMTCLCSLS